MKRIAGGGDPYDGKTVLVFFVPSPPVLQRNKREGQETGEEVLRFM